MKALTYISHNNFALNDKPKPQLLAPRDTIVRVALSCDCAEILRLIKQGKIDTTPLITHRYKLADIEEAYRVFEGKLDGVIKVTITQN